MIDTRSKHLRWRIGSGSRRAGRPGEARGEFLETSDPLVLDVVPTCLSVARAARPRASDGHRGQGALQRVSPKKNRGRGIRDDDSERAMQKGSEEQAVGGGGRTRPCSSSFDGCCAAPVWLLSPAHQLQSQAGIIEGTLKRPRARGWQILTRFLREGEGLGSSRPHSGGTRRDFIAPPAQERTPARLPNLGTRVRAELGSKKLSRGEAAS